MGTAISSRTPKPDVFDRIGDAVGSGVRRAVTNPLTATGQFKLLWDNRDGVRAAAKLGARAGSRAASEGAKGAVEAATLLSPPFAVARAIIDPAGTKKTVGTAMKAAKAYIESPLTGYGLLKRGVEFATDHPEGTKDAAKAVLKGGLMGIPGVGILASLF